MLHWKASSLAQWTNLDYLCKGSPYVSEQATHACPIQNDRYKYHPGLLAEGWQ